MMHSSAGLVAAGDCVIVSPGDSVCDAVRMKTLRTTG